MNTYERAEKIAKYIKERIDALPDTAIVLGSGLGKFGESVKVVKSFDYKEFPDFPVPTVPGHSGKLIFGYTGNKYICAMQGRFHIYEGYNIQDVTIHIRVFKLLGIKNLILTNASGAINVDFHPGELMLIQDHIGLFCDSALFGQNDERFGPRFPSMSEAYDKSLRKIANEAAKKCGITLREGVYCYTKGPNYETPAEIRALRNLGADCCGMSTVPEAVTAVHCGIKVLGISCLTNMASGILDTPLSHEEVLETGKKSEQMFKSLISEICLRL